MRRHEKSLPPTTTREQIPGTQTLTRSPTSGPLKALPTESALLEAESYLTGAPLPARREEVAHPELGHRASIKLSQLPSDTAEQAEATTPATAYTDGGFGKFGLPASLGHLGPEAKMPLSPDSKTRRSGGRGHRKKRDFPGSITSISALTAGRETTPGGAGLSATPAESGTGATPPGLPTSAPTEEPGAPRRGSPSQRRPAPGDSGQEEGGSREAGTGTTPRSTPSSGPPDLRVDSQILL